MKKLVICCDGTWNKPDDQTHIWRIHEAAMAKHGLSASPNDPNYVAGVGTKRDEEDTWPERIADKIAGGAFGKGISSNVRDAYRYLALSYEEGDEIYILGFSRGAYTARSLAGLLAHAGLVAAQDNVWTEAAYEAYRSKEKDNSWPPTEIAHRIRHPIPIRFLGVFDTVGSLGVPIGWLQSLGEMVNPKRDVRFHNTNLGKDVQHASHALAIDEHRGPFKPTLWTGTPAAGQTVRQVWFAGVHSDVGGGYDDKKLADIALDWMLQEMAEAGLDLRSFFESAADFDPRALGPAHDSMSPGHKLLHMLPSIDSYWRPIGGEQRLREEPSATPVPGEGLSWAVLDRIAAPHAPSASGDTPYRPKNLPLDEKGHVLLPDDVEIIDRRRAKRVPVELDAELDGIGACVIRDLSRTGARISVGHIATPEGTRKIITSNPPIGERPAVIRWCRPEDGEIGVRFDDPLEVELLTGKVAGTAA